MKKLLIKWLNSKRCTGQMLKDHFNQLTLSIYLVNVENTTAMLMVLKRMKEKTFSNLESHQCSHLKCQLTWKTKYKRQASMWLQVLVLKTQKSFHRRKKMQFHDFLRWTLFRKNIGNSVSEEQRLPNHSRDCWSSDQWRFKSWNQSWGSKKRSIGLANEFAQKRFRTLWYIVQI